MTLHPLLARALRSHALRKRPMSLVVLVALLDDGLVSDAPKPVAVGGLSETLRARKDSIRAALAVLVARKFLTLHERSGRGVGIYSLGKGATERPLSAPNTLPTEDCAA